VINIVRCPFCGYEAELDKFKLLRESWKSDSIPSGCLSVLDVVMPSTTIRGLALAVRSLSMSLRLCLEVGVTAMAEEPTERTYATELAKAVTIVGDSLGFDAEVEKKTPSGYSDIVIYFTEESL